jgi:Transposase DDE domain
VRFRRFLSNERVTVAEMVERAATRTAAAATDCHVLAIQDTSEINYQAKAGRKRDLGTVGNGSDVGLFVHPVLTVAADTGVCLGLADVQVWRRTTGKAPDYRRQPLEAKESHRWLAGAQAAQARLTSARLITIVADRESDIYELWTRVPDERTHVLTRAGQDRALAAGGLLFATLASWPQAATYEVDLPARAGTRAAHRAVLAVRFGEIELCRPSTCSARRAPATVRLRAIDVREIAAPPDDPPVHWRLLTTHAVTTVAEARQVIGWYCLRWTVEQLFRTVKRQGLDLENSLIESGAALEKLAVMALIGAATTLQLVLARAPGALEQPASRAFDRDEIMVLAALQTSLQGRTAKQQNPDPPNTLAWAAWTIARLGGWTGYASERPPGPITMRDGLHRFAAICDGWLLAKNVCSH